MKTIDSIKKSCWTIFKLIFPIYIAVDILKYTGVLTFFSQFFEPITKLIGLPAEAALALAGGGLFNLYTGIALASPLGLSAQQWTTIAVFLGIFHSIIIEAAVLKKLSIPVWATVTIRFGAAVTCSYLVFFWQTDSGIPVGQEAIQLQSFSSFLEMLRHSVINAATVTMKIILLIALIIIAFDSLKKSAYFGRSVAKHSWLFNVTVGLLLGVTYGAGLLLNTEVKQTTSSLPSAFFLLLCHGIIEETLLFTMFGASAWPVVLCRFFSALSVAAICYYLVQPKQTQTTQVAEELV